MSRRGFTLVELAMTFVVAGILFSIATVSFVAVRNRTSDSTRGNELRQVAASFALFAQSRGYFPSSEGTASGVEPAYSYVAATVPSTSESVVSVGTATIDGAAYVGLARLGSSGTCMTIAVPKPNSSKPAFTASFVPSPSAPCTASAALAKRSSEW